MGEREDKRRFDAMVLPYLADAVVFARWLTGDAADAEDVVQEAAERAFKAIATCDPQKARGWFLAIVRNAAFTWMARNKPKSTILTDDLDTPEMVTALQSGPSPPTPEAALIAKMDSVALHEAIARLPGQFREAIVLRELSELTYQEIADIVRVPVGTVMSRLSRGRALLVADLLQRAAVKP